MIKEGKNKKRTGESEHPEEDGKIENKFSKDQLLVTERFRDRRDILNALLDMGELYTIKEVEEKIENYMKGRVQ